jgi:parallel beta-helix repeat protein
MVFIALLLLSLLLPLTTWATTYHVDSTPPIRAAVNCLEAQNASTPHDTIQEGMDCLASGDTLEIHGGTYAQTLGTVNGIPNGTAGAYTTIRATAGETVTIRGITFSAAASYIEFVGLVVDNNFTSNEAVYFGTAGGMHHLRIAQCEIKNAQGQGVLTTTADLGSHEFLENNIHDNGLDDHHDHGLYIGSPNNLIEGNVIHHNAAFGIQIYNSTGSGANNNRIVRNRFHSNATKQLVGTGFEVAVYLGAGSGNLAANNLIYNNPASNGLNLGPNCVNCFAYNNTIYGNEGYGIIIQGTQPVVRNNLLVANGADQLRIVAGTVSPTLTHNLTSTSDPEAQGLCVPTWQSTNPDATNFLKLAAGSCAIDSGATLLAVATDYWRTPRPWPLTLAGGGPGAYDVGAYEFVGTSNPPVVAITSPTAASTYASPTESLATVSGTASDPQGNGTITGVTWACPQCTPASGSASYNSSAGTWSFGPVTLTAGGVANVLTVTASDGTLTGQDSLTATYTDPTGCTHYASPGGGGDGSSQGSPMTVAQFLAAHETDPGTTLCLLNGTYSPILISTAFAGTEAQPITLRALNDGQVTVTGGVGERAVDLRGNWGVLEGINVGGGGGDVLIMRGTDWVARRVIVWNNYLTGSDTGLIAMGGLRNTLEDCAAFGVSRKLIAAGASVVDASSYNVVRRCWARYENRIGTGSPTEIFELGYRGQNDVLFENLIGTRDRVPGGGLTSPEAPLLIASSDHGRLYGSIAYARAGAQFDAAELLTAFPGDPPLGYRLTTNNEIKDVVALVEQGYQAWGNLRPVTLYAVEGAGNVATNIVSVGGIIPYCESRGWSGCGTIRHGSTLATAIGAGNSVWNEVPGICTRYVNGTLTSEPLWPWPMNQRIMDALTASGRTPVDITATMETLFGAIPAQCRTGAPTPVLNPPTNLQVTSFNAVVPRSAQLAWQYTPGSDPVAGFRLYHQPGCTGPFSLVGSTLPASPLSTTHEALTVSASYCWYLTAVNAGGTESLPSATTSYTPSPDEPPVIPPSTGGGGSVGGMPVPGGPGLPLVLTSQPVKRDHPLLLGARAWWRIVPWLWGGSTWYDLLERVPAVATAMTGTPWSRTTRLDRDGEMLLPGGAAHFSTGTVYTDNGPFSVVLWAQPGPDRQHLIGQTTTGWTSGWGIWRSESAWLMCAKDTSDLGVTATAQLFDGVWAHLACTWDGTVLAFYVNGVLQGEATLPTAYPAGLPLTIGGLPNYRTEGWAGSLDDVLLYTRALTATEVKRLYQVMSQGDRELLQTWSPFVQYGQPGRRLVRGGGFLQR